MKSLSIAVMAAALFLFGSVSAHQERYFDGGKSIYFQQIADTAKNRANTLSRHSKKSARCIGGFAAGIYPCHKIDLLSHIDIGELGVSFVNDIWGWSDRWTGREFALLGATEGTIAIDVTYPRRPFIVGMLPTASDDKESPFWRDIKVYKNHAFIVSEHTDHGMQVLDLRQLRKIRRRNAPVELKPAAQYDGFSSSHNIAINTRTGYAYVVGADTCLGGLEIVDIIRPSKPKPVACFDKHGYVHDTQCVIYKGRDYRFWGREICFNSSANTGTPFFNTLSIVDVTNKRNIKALANVKYGSGLGYSHQGWLTPGQGHFIHGDELDEFFTSVPNTTTRIWNLKSLTNPVLIAETTNGNTSIDHNMYTRRNLSFASNYTSGLRIFDTRKIRKGKYKELAYFDMYPENDNPTFEGGTWSNYAYFWDKRLIAVSSMDRGLFLLRHRLNRFGRYFPYYYGGH